MKRIAMCSNPDVDVVVATWLSERFLFDDPVVEVAVVPRGSRARQGTRHDVFVGVGHGRDPLCLNFGSRGDSNSSPETTNVSGAVWWHLLGLGRPVAHLVDFINAIGNGASPSGAPKQGKPSEVPALHEVFSGAKSGTANEESLYETMKTWLNDKERSLRSSLASSLNWERAIWRLPAVKGTYALILRAEAPGAIVVGRRGFLGRLEVRTGFYAYIGSAFGPGGLRGRCKHHLTPAHRLKAKWQVDFLRLLPPVVEIWYTTDAIKRECAWATCMQKVPGSEEAHPKFGATDCDCAAHLFDFSAMPSLASFRARVSRLKPSGCRVGRVVVPPYEEPSQEMRTDEEFDQWLREFSFPV